MVPAGARPAAKRWPAMVPGQGVLQGLGLDPGGILSCDSCMADTPMADTPVADTPIWRTRKGVATEDLKAR